MIDYWKSEYELRQFIDIATRWKITGVYASRTAENPYSIFDYDVKTARENFELFSNQLREKLSENANWKAIEIDLKDRFLKMINLYTEWHQSHKKETEIFGQYNPYSIMFSIIESTRKEILKYFPVVESAQEVLRKYHYKEGKLTNERIKEIAKEHGASPDSWKRKYNNHPDKWGDKFEAELKSMKK